MSISIRRARLADCPAVERLGRVPEISIAPGWYLPLEYYQRVIKEHHYFFVAEVKKVIVGFAIAEKIVAGVLGQYTVVQKSYRRHGIGIKLMRAIERQARTDGAYFMLGYAVAKSTGMQKALKHLGWRRSHLTYEWSKGLQSRPRRGRLGAPKR